MIKGIRQRDASVFTEGISNPLRIFIGSALASSDI